MDRNLSPLNDFSPFNAMNIEVLLSEAETAIQAEDYDGASQMLENVLTKNSECMEAWFLLGRIVDLGGDFATAITFVKKTILLNPQSYKVYLYLADMYMRQGKINEAKEVYQYLAQKEEARRIPEFFLGVAVVERAEGNHTQAKKRLKQYLKLASKSNLVNIQKNTSHLSRILQYEILSNCDVELILDSKVEEQENVRKFMDCAEKLIKSGRTEDGLPLNTSNILFQLAYYTANPRPYLEKAAELYRKVFPELIWTSPHCQNNSVRSLNNKKIKMGIVSTQLDEAHAVGYCFAPLVSAIVNSNSFEIIYFKINSGNSEGNPVNGFLESITTVVLPLNGKIAREIIASYALDILWYTDLIMVEQSTILGHSRLAPIQCVSGGHPVTSGLPTIDYFISSALQETSKAQENYTERLILLPCFPVIYPEFHLQHNTLTRKELGLPEKGRIESFTLG